MTLLYGIVTLEGSNPTHILFGPDGPATIIGDNAGPWDMSGVGDGGTIIMNPDGDGNQTATINASAGNLTGGSSASTDMTSEPDTKLEVSVDGGDFEEVVFDWTGCNSGALIAAQMQSAIRALGGTFANVAVAFSTNKYVITSPTLGTKSAIAVTNADDHDCADELDLTDNAVATVGTGDCVDLAAVTYAEVRAVCLSDMSGLEISASAGAIGFSSDSDGPNSSLAVGAGTLNSVLGFTESESVNGSQGLGYVDVDIDDTAYVVSAMLIGISDPAGKGLSWRNPTVTGFDLYCETAGATDRVGIMVAIDDD